MNSWYRLHWLNFLLLGSLLFVGKLYLDSRAPRPIEALDQEVIQRLHDDWVRQTGRLPSEEQMQSMKQHELETRMLFAEALRRHYHRDDTVVLNRLLRDADFLGMQGTDEEKIRAALDLGLHLSDEVIRRRMIQRIELEARQFYISSAPSESELEAIYLENQERWEIPQRYRFQHIFYSADKPGDPRLRAEQDLDGLLSGTVTEVQGDPFLHGQSVAAKSLRELAFLFGSDFSDELGSFEPEAGRWYGPVASAYGYHVLYMEEVIPGKTPPLAEVRDKVMRIWQEQQQQASLKQYIAELSKHYEVAQ